MTDPETTFGESASGEALSGELPSGEGASDESPAVEPRNRSDSAKPVTAVSVQAGEYHNTHRYVGAIQSWVAARLGPQLVSASAVDLPPVAIASMTAAGEVPPSAS